MASRIVTGLDIGTTKICSVVANITEQGEFEVLGCGIVPSKGLKKGVIVNIEDASNAIAASLERAETQAGFELRQVFIGISGGHIEGINSKGVVAITDKNKEISAADVQRAVDAAKAVVIPLDREVIHIIPQQFIVDDQDGIKDPVGMYGSRLEVVVHIITAAASSVGNLMKSVAKAGYEATDIILEPLASAQSVLTEEEKDLGVALVDIGGGTTDYVIFEEGSLRHTGILPVGGNHITNDVALCLKTSNPSAEQIKIEYGAALSDFIDDDEEIEVPGLGGRAASVEKRKFLVDVMQPRIEEMLSMINKQFEKTGEKDYLAGGVVLTGGVSMTPYIADLAAEIFDLPVRVGRPLGVKGLRDIVNTPIHSTAVGLAMYNQLNAPKAAGIAEGEQEERAFKPFLKKLKEWLNEFF